jgi:hypothetical protein
MSIEIFISHKVNEQNKMINSLKPKKSIPKTKKVAKSKPKKTTPKPKKESKPKMTSAQLSRKAAGYALAAANAMAREKKG